MVNFYNNLSPATKLLIQSFLAVLGSVLSGVAVAVYQNYIMSGQINVAVLWNVALVTFALLFGKAMHDWIPAHAQQLLKAAQDEKAAMYDAMVRSQNVTSAVIATQGKQVQSAKPLPPPVLMQAAAPSLRTEDVSAIAAQLAMNLMNIAANNKAQTPAAPVAPTTPVPPAEPVPDPYVDPLRNSAVLPAYVPPVAIPDQATQSVPVPFTV